MKKMYLWHRLERQVRRRHLLSAKPANLKGFIQVEIDLCVVVMWWVLARVLVSKGTGSRILRQC
jgi:hypothetical protein